MRFCFYLSLLLSLTILFQGLDLKHLFSKINNVVTMVSFIKLVQFSDMRRPFTLLVVNLCFIIVDYNLLGAPVSIIKSFFFYLIGI